jgi:hypothetical protein
LESIQFKLESQAVVPYEEGERCRVNADFKTIENIDSYLHLEKSHHKYNFTGMHGFTVISLQVLQNFSAISTETPSSEANGREGGRSERGGRAGRGGRSARGGRATATGRSLATRGSVNNQSATSSASSSAFESSTPSASSADSAQDSTPTTSSAPPTSEVSHIPIELILLKYSDSITNATAWKTFREDCIQPIATDRAGAASEEINGKVNSLTNT